MLDLCNSLAFANPTPNYTLWLDEPMTQAGRASLYNVQWICMHVTATIFVRDGCLPCIGHSLLHCAGVLKIYLPTPWTHTCTCMCIH